MPEADRLVEEVARAIASADDMETERALRVHAPYYLAAAKAVLSRLAELDAPGPEAMSNSLASAGEDLSDLCRLLEDGTQALALAECALASVDHAATLAASPSTEGRAGEGIASESQPPERGAKDSSVQTDAPSPAGPSTEGLTEENERLDLSGLSRAIGLASAIRDAEPYPPHMDGVRTVAGEIVELLEPIRFRRLSGEPSR